jgi:uncharacterized protein YcbX
MQGEDLTGSSFTASGIPGDRHWGVLDVETGVGISASEPRMLEASATVARAMPSSLPDGSTVTSADSKVGAVLSAWLGRDVS